jgi:hypothetical protein
MNKKEKMEKEIGKKKKIIIKRKKHKSEKTNAPTPAAAPTRPPRMPQSFGDTG